MSLLKDIADIFVSPIVSYFTTKKTNETNKKNVEATNRTNQAINQANIDYNTAMTQQQWERDDTAHQREVADLEAAGLSPLANTTGSQVTSALGAPSPIAMQAPQIDSSSFINSVIQASALAEEKRHNLANETHNQAEELLRGEEIKNQAEKLQIENKQVENTIKYQASLIENENKTINEAIRHNKEEEYLRKVEYESENYFKEIKQQIGGDFAYKDYYDFDIYCDAKKLWNLQFQHFLEKIGATQTAFAKSISDRESVGIGANVMGSGGNVNGSTDYSHSEYESENISKKQEEMIKEFYNSHPQPVFHLYKPKG